MSRKYEGISAPKIEILEWYVKKGGKAGFFHDLPTDVQIRLQMGYIHELLEQDVNRWLQDHGHNPHMETPDWLSAESFAAEKVVSWICDECGNDYHTEDEAEECRCKTADWTYKQDLLDGNPAPAGRTGWSDIVCSNCGDFESVETKIIPEKCPSCNYWMNAEVFEAISDDYRISAKRMNPLSRHYIPPSVNESFSADAETVEGDGWFSVSYTSTEEQANAEKKRFDEATFRHQMDKDGMKRKGNYRYKVMENPDKQGWTVLATRDAEDSLTSAIRERIYGFPISNHYDTCSCNANPCNCSIYCQDCEKWTAMDKVHEVITCPHCDTAYEDNMNYRQIWGAESGDEYSERRKKEKEDAVRQRDVGGLKGKDAAAWFWGQSRIIANEWHDKEKAHQLLSHFNLSGFRVVPVEMNTTLSGSGILVFVLLQDFHDYDEEGLHSERTDVVGVFSDFYGAMAVGLRDIARTDLDFYEALFPKVWREQWGAESIPGDRKLSRYTEARNKFYDNPNITSRISDNPKREGESMTQWERRLHSVSDGYDAESTDRFVPSKAVEAKADLALIGAGVIVGILIGGIIVRD